MAKWYDYAMPAIPLTREIGRRTGLSNLFSNPDMPGPQQLDISAELAMIDEMYKQQKSQTEASLGRALQEQNKLTAQSLAGRGIYSSPVSQYSFGANQKSYAQSLADALADLSAKQLAQKAQLSASAKQYNLGQQSQYDASRYESAMRNRQALRNALLGIGGAGLGLATGGASLPFTTTLTAAQPAMYTQQPIDRQPRY